MSVSTNNESYTIHCNLLGIRYALYMACVVLFSNDFFPQLCLVYTSRYHGRVDVFGQEKHLVDIRLSFPAMNMIWRGTHTLIILQAC